MNSSPGARRRPLKFQVTRAPAVSLRLLATPLHKSEASLEIEGRRVLTVLGVGRGRRIRGWLGAS
jgi:hypothetical protein